MEICTIVIGVSMVSPRGKRLRSKKVEGHSDLLRSSCTTPPLSLELVGPYSARHLRGAPQSVGHYACTACTKMLMCEESIFISFSSSVVKTALAASGRLLTACKQP